MSNSQMCTFSLQQLFTLNNSSQNTSWAPHTMLQKLSKCEVKAWLCWIWSFTVASILREITFWRIQTVQKCHSWQFCRFWILILVNLSHFQVPNLPKFQVQSLKNGQKWHFWTVWNHLNLISCKIWVAVKLSNFNKFKP